MIDEFPTRGRLDTFAKSQSPLARIKARQITKDLSADPSSLVTIVWLQNKARTNIQSL
jgi:hypothetical protein